MEHQIYRVVRKTNRTFVKLALEDYPNITVRAATAGEAEERLYELICEKFGDGEPVLDYIDFLVPVATGLAWQMESNQGLTTTNLQAVYPAGICDRCGHVLGRRSSVVRAVSECIRADVAFTRSGRQFTMVFSEAMVSVLVELGLKRTDFASVSDLSRKVFWELLGDGADLASVPVKPSIAHKAGALRCPKCHYSRFGFVHHKESSIWEFVLESDWNRSKALVRVLGPLKPKLVFSSEARDRILKHKELRGFVWSRVALVAPEQVEQNLKYDIFPKP